jgi:predicted O-methyltransferase YrrM
MNEKEYVQEISKAVEIIPGWLSLNEARLLFHLARSVKGEQTILEVGSWKGRSTVSLGLGLVSGSVNGKIYAVDPHEGIIAGKKKLEGPTFKEFVANCKRFRVEKFVIPVRKTSTEAAKNWDRPIDFLFIDGLHDEAHALEDYQLWNSHVQNGGVIAFHDGFLGEAGVWNVIRSFVLPRKDIVDMGTVTTIFYIRIGKPNTLEKIRVQIKRRIVLLAYALNTRNYSKQIKRVFIHILLRLFLLTPETVAVYTYGRL